MIHALIGFAIFVVAFKLGVRAERRRNRLAMAADLSRAFSSVRFVATISPRRERPEVN